MWGRHSVHTFLNRSPRRSRSGQRRTHDVPQVRCKADAPYAARMYVVSGIRRTSLRTVRLQADGAVVGSDESDEPVVEKIVSNKFVGSAARRATAVRGDQMPRDQRFIDRVRPGGRAERGLLRHTPTATTPRNAPDGATPFGQWSALWSIPVGVMRAQRTRLRGASSHSSFRLIWRHNRPAPWRRHRWSPRLRRDRRS